MEFQDFEPVYDAILADFGFGREADEAARDLLADLVESVPASSTDSLESADAAARSMRLSASRYCPFSIRADAMRFHSLTVAVSPVVECCSSDSICRA